MLTTVSRKTTYQTCPAVRAGLAAGTASAGAALTNSSQCSGVAEPDSLAAQIAFHAGDAALRADAGLSRRLVRRGVAGTLAGRSSGMNAHRRADALRHPHACRQAGCPDISGQPVNRVVSDAHGFVFIVERDDRQHRPEHLFLGECGFRRDVTEQRRLDEVTAGLAERGLAAHDELRTVCARILDVAQDPRMLLGR